MSISATTTNNRQAPAHDDTTWRAILAIARRAPSPHNVQPWRVQILSATEAELFIDRTRTLPSEDTTGAFLLSAMGLFVEAIALLAALRGLRLTVHQHCPATELAVLVSQPAEPASITQSSKPGPIQFARLTLAPGPATDPEYEEALFLARRTSRLPLRPAPVPSWAAARLAALSLPWGHTYTQLSRPAQIDPIIAHNIGAVFHDLNVPAYHDEIATWFRFTRRQSDATNDGLDFRCMNVSRPEFWLSARLPGILQAPILRTLLKRRYRRQLGHVPAIGILAGDFFNPENAVQSGRFLMRFWLETARLGLCIHPLGNLVTNPEAAAWLQTHTGVKGAWLVFKIGFSETPPLSNRRDLDDILIGAAQ